MFGSNDQKTKDTVPVMGPVTDEVVSSTDDNQSASDFSSSNISLPSKGGPRVDDSSPTVTPAAPASDDHSTDHLLTSGDNDDLVHIKQEALQQLSPLVGHLEQTPEEKFRTTMMMIQASDDQTLVKTAYDAAKSISDDKVRAQALLDIINEINYFTQQAKQ